MLFVGESPTNAPVLTNLVVHKDISWGRHKADLTSPAPSRWLTPLFETLSCAGAHVVGGWMALHLLCLVIHKLAMQRFEGKWGQFDASFPPVPR